MLFFSSDDLLFGVKVKGLVLIPYTPRSSVFHITRCQESVHSSKLIAHSKKLGNPDAFDLLSFPAKRCFLLSPQFSALITYLFTFNLEPLNREP